MKGYLINSFTPLVSSELDSRFVRTGNRIFNVTYSTLSIVSILALGISDPFNFGHMPTAAAVFLFFGFIGVRIQKSREKDFDVEKEYDTVINEFVVIQQKITLNCVNNSTDENPEAHDESNSFHENEGARLLTETEKVQTNKRGRKKLKDGETPFIDNEYERFFCGIMESIPDHSLQGVDVNAIARSLRDKPLNKGKFATKSHASIPTITKWILECYAIKIVQGIVPSTLKTAKPGDDLIKSWKDKFTRS